jgi:C1A family cysteine protease
MRYATGYLQDQPDDRDLPAEALLESADASGAWPRSALGGMSVDLRTFNPSVLDQGQAGSCVVHAIGKQIQLTWILENNPQAPLPNLLAMYWQSRKFHGAEGQRDGTYPRFAYKALQTYGYAREDAYRYSPSLVLLPIPPRVYRASYDQKRKVQYYRISATGKDRKAQIEQALSQFRPVSMSLTLDDAFFDSSDLTPWSFRGPDRGGHYVLAIGFNAEGVLILNSWGTSWKQQGYVLVRWETILDGSCCKDLYVVTFVPRIST